MTTDPNDPARTVGVSAAVDRESLQATCEISQKLMLDEQLRLLIKLVAAWSGAPRVFALGPGEERASWSPIASLAHDDADLARLGKVDPAALRAALDGGQERFDGLGPLESESEPWDGRRPRSVAILPVTDEEERWAAVVLMMFDADPRPGQLQRIARLLQAIRPAITNAREVAAMRELVIKDDTAHCFNRRYFETCLPDELARANRFHAALSLIFLDMDNLKQVNKLHGHAMGSRTLSEVSARVRIKIRRFDKLFRFGGDEFCIVLPETEWHGALEVAERVRDSIASNPFLTSELGPEGVRMTASLGIASFPLHARSQEELIEHADRAMQRIKNGTKNSIGVAEIIGDKHGK